MTSRSHPLLAGTTVLLAALPLQAVSAEFALSIDLPRKKHRPYVAVWVENDARTRVADLAIWHEGARKGKKDKKERAGKEKKDKGDKYLPDLRQWWRSGGNRLALPIDGVTGPTRPAGVHTLRFAQGSEPLGNLPAGSYRVMVESSREDGDDETLTFPLSWPPRQTSEQRQEGRTELGEVVLTVKP